MIKAVIGGCIVILALFVLAILAGDIVARLFNRE